MAVVRTGVVCLLDHILLVLKLDHHTNGTKDLLADDLHVRLDVCEDGGLDKVALFTVSVSTKVNGRAFLFAGFDVAHDTLVLNVGHLRALVSLSAEWVADANGSSLGGEALKEFVVDAGLDKDTRSSAACLAVVPAGRQSQARCIGLDRMQLTRDHEQPSSLPDPDLRH